MTKKQPLQSLIIYSLFWCLFYSTPALSAVKLRQAQQSLSQIEKQISEIKTRIKKDKTSQDQIQSAISKTLNKIKKNHLKQKQLQLKLLTLHERISTLENSLKQTQQILNTTQMNIYEHLNIHLQLAQEPFWQIVFGAKDPFEYYQRVELYHYLHQSEQEQIVELKKNESTLTKQQYALLQNLKNLEHLQNLLAQKEQHFSDENESQLLALETLHQKISDKKSQLVIAVKNQTALKQLIQQLLKNNHLQTPRSFSTVKRGIKLPVPSTYRQYSKIQNGILFQTPEDTEVFAVSPGKVVFSEWLNGYGYLVIIDHGWGLMSLYGNNHALLKHKGESVQQGDAIATVGHSGSFRQTGLYFEIRQRAKVMAAQDWFNHAHV